MNGPVSRVLFDFAAGVFLGFNVMAWAVGVWTLATTTWWLLADLPAVRRLLRRARPH